VLHSTWLTRFRPCGQALADAIEVIKKTKTDPNAAGRRGWQASSRRSWSSRSINRSREHADRLRAAHRLFGPVAHELILTVLDDIGADLLSWKT
jgi:hypothetical protein